MSQQLNQFRQLRRFQMNRQHQLALGLLVLYLALASFAAGASQLPGALAGALLGGCLWWVARRLFGDRGGLLALVFYLCSPISLLAARQLPFAGMLAAIVLFGGVYACIGVAHAMQGPLHKWPPRLMLLTAAFTVALLADPMAWLLLALLGLFWMAWVAEYRRALVMLLGAASLLASQLLGFAARLAVPNLAGSGWKWPHFCPQNLQKFFDFVANPLVFGLTLVAFLLLLVDRRARYLGNLAPLISALVVLLLGTAGNSALALYWAWPFWLLGLAGIFADGMHLRWARILQPVLVVLALNGAIQMVLQVVALRR